MGYFNHEYTKENGFVQSKFHKLLWPNEASGNRVNRVGEPENHRPVQSYHKHHPFYPFGMAEQWFIHKCMANFKIANWYLKHWITENVTRLGKIASQRQEDTAENWTKKIKELALADEDVHVVGICRMKQEWVYEDREIPRGEWVIVLGRRMEYDEFSKNIKGDFVSQCREVIKSYVMGQTTGYRVASWIRKQGYYSSFKGGLSDDHSFTVIPAAIEAGLGQLGKHGSMISDVMGSAFRITPVLTDMPLIPDEARDIGVDDFCATCQLCARDCPADAITHEKQMVNGNLKWYVNFDKCVPAFNELYACGLCLAVCPWSRPGVAPSLTQKMLRRRERKVQGAT
jgi:ferredoxin